MKEYTKITIRPAIEAEVSIKIDFENRMIETDCKEGSLFLQALQSIWTEDEEARKYPYPIFDGTWTYKFTEGLPIQITYEVT